MPAQQTLTKGDGSRIAVALFLMMVTLICLFRFDLARKGSFGAESRPEWEFESPRVASFGQAKLMGIR